MTAKFYADLEGDYTPFACNPKHMPKMNKYECRLDFENDNELGEVETIGGIEAGAAGYIMDNAHVYGTGVYQVIVKDKKGDLYKVSVAVDFEPRIQTSKAVKL